MSTLSRIYERQAKPLSLTLVPYRTISLMPVVLVIVLTSLALKLMKQAKIHIIAAARPDISALAQTNELSQDSVSFDELALFSPEVRAWDLEIHRWSEEHALPPSLVAIVMQIESCGAPQVKSAAGAMGLFQVMPFHFSSQEDPFDPETNAGRGLQYLARAYELADGSIDKTLAGYNGGHSVITLDPKYWPEETLRYVKWGTGIWIDLQSGDMRSDTLNQWLGAGGEHLCQKARE